MPHRESTVRSRELGEGLRAAMERAGLNGKQTARALDWSPSFVSMLLTGKRNASEVDISAFLGVCRVTGEERERLLALSREQDAPGWFQPHGSRLPKQLVTLIDHENKATTISVFEAILVPGLLQTGQYARAAISRSVNVPHGEVNDRVAARLARQSLFARDRPAQFTFYLHESVLRTPVGGPAVMAEQLDHLHRMSARSYLSVRVVPIALGAHPAMAGAFSYSFGNGDCVQVGWRTSSYSAGNGGCVQVAPTPERVLVRDSKNPEGSALAIPTPAWRAFLATLTP